MDIEIFPTPHLIGKIQAPPSKSYTHRAVIMAALADGTSTISQPLIGSDTSASIRAMRTLGAEISDQKDKLIIKGINHFKIPKETINVDNSGTTIRFLTALAAHVSGTVRLTGDASIERRPMAPLLEALSQVGIECYSEKGDGTPPIIIKGRTWQGTTISIPGNISSQFISGLLISSPLAPQDITIHLTTPPKSTPYLLMTSEMMRKFGINHQYDPKTRSYSIAGNQTYKPINFTVPGDFSSAAFFLAAAAILDGEISISNLNMENPQGDKEIIPIVERIGAKINIDPQNKVVIVKNHTLKPFEMDCGNIPDLVPILAVLASFIPGKSKLFNAAHLRIKESDRLHTITTELQKMQVDIRELSDALLITGSSEHEGAVLESHDDHRIAMALIIAALPLKEKTIIKNVECIKVSYPSFLEDLKKLGGQFKVIN